MIKNITFPWHKNVYWLIKVIYLYLLFSSMLDNYYFSEAYGKSKFDIFTNIFENQITNKIIIINSKYFELFLTILIIQTIFLLLKQESESNKLRKFILLTFLLPFSALFINEVTTITIIGIVFKYSHTLIDYHFIISVVNFIFTSSLIVIVLFINKVKVN